MNEPAATWELTTSLLPWSKNPRKNDGEPVNRVAESIKAYGFAAPIVARAADRRIIAGHTRWKAAKLLKLDKVPVRFVDLGDRESDALALADNRVGEWAQWDSPALLAILQSLQADNMDLGPIGFDVEQLETLLASTGDFNDDIAGALGDLAEGDKAGIQAMSFVLSDDQAADIKRALKAAKEQGPFVDTGNENSNGNALARIVEHFLGGS